MKWKQDRTKTEEDIPIDVNKSTNKKSEVTIEMLHSRYANMIFRSRTFSIFPSFASVWRTSSRVRYFLGGITPFYRQSQIAVTVPTIFTRKTCDVLNFLESQRKRAIH